jgi:hypothetical protein
VTDRLVVDLGDGGVVRVGMARDGELLSFGEPVPLAWPLGMEALEQAWRGVTGAGVPGVVMDYVKEFLREETAGE